MTLLRGHHLICLHFFDGEGYSRRFITNLKDILRRIETGPVITCSGADEVCAKCPYLQDSTCHYDNNSDEDIRGMDEKALQLLNLSAGEEIEWDVIRKNLPRIMQEWYPAYCLDCDWLKACSRNEAFGKLGEEPQSD